MSGHVKTTPGGMSGPNLPPRGFPQGGVSNLSQEGQRIPHLNPRPRGPRGAPDVNALWDAGGGQVREKGLCRAHSPHSQWGISSKPGSDTVTGVTPSHTCVRKRAGSKSSCSHIPDLSRVVAIGKEERRG